MKETTGVDPARTGGIREITDPANSLGYSRSEFRQSLLGIRPQERRHSYVTHLQAAGINDADLAEIAGH